MDEIKHLKDAFLAGLLSPSEFSQRMDEVGREEQARRKLAESMSRNEFKWVSGRGMVAKTQDEWKAWVETSMENMRKADTKIVNDQARAQKDIEALQDKIEDLENWFLKFEQEVKKSDVMERVESFSLLGDDW